MFERINWLVAEEGFQLRSWKDFIGGEIWVFVPPRSLDIQKFQKAIQQYSMGHSPFDEKRYEYTVRYLNSANWLPFTSGKDLYDALSKLEARLQKYPESELNEFSRWGEAVEDAFDYLDPFFCGAGIMNANLDEAKLLDEDYTKVWRSEEELAS